MNWATRKIAKRLTPKIIISFVKSPSDDEKLLRIEYQTVVKNMEQLYKCPGITKHRGLKLPTVKLKIPGKHFLYFSQFFHGSVLAKSQPLPLVDS